MGTKLRIATDDPLYQLLREGKIVEFNNRIAGGETPNLVNCDLRGTNLRGLDADGLDLRGCYFRQADVRGIDFSNSNLEGASINGAKISGALFPAQISAEEITLSLLHGTRLRYDRRTG